jgi:Protein of unknown function (DUF2946)
MDHDVLQAMARWPNVPAAYGWLRLDRRGQWYIVKRDLPNFDEQTDGIGSLVRNERLNDFIGRNYTCNEEGQWFFQNGPQRVFVDLELAPWVLRIDNSLAALKWVTHTGAVALQCLAAYLDNAGNVFIKTEIGVGVIDDRQLARLAPYIQERDGDLTLAFDSPVVMHQGTDCPTFFGFQKQPRFNSN